MISLYAVLVQGLSRDQSVRYKGCFVNDAESCDVASLVISGCAILVQGLSRDQSVCGIRVVT